MTVSALVSAYYSEKFLHQRLTNLYGQKGVDLQIIVAAQKGTPEEAIAGQHDLELVLTDNVPTIGEAWNLCIERADGDLLTTANTDDRYLIGGLKRMVQVFEDDPDIGLVFSQVNMDNGVSVTPWTRISNATGEVQNIADLLASRCFIGPMPVWRRNIHDDVGYFDETFTVASDYEMWLRMARKDIRFYYIADSCGVYRKRPDSLEWRNKDLLFQENARIQCEMV